MCLNILGSTGDLGGGRGPDRPFPRAGSSHPRGKKAAESSARPDWRGERAKGSSRPVGPAARSLLRARGPSQAAPPSKAPRAWGPEKPYPRPSGTALAAPRPSPYRSPLAAVTELPGAHLPLGGPRVKPGATTPPQARAAAAAAPTGAPAATDDWLPGVGACNLIGREAKLGACARGGTSGGNRWGRGQAKPESQGS